MLGAAPKVKIHNPRGRNQRNKLENKVSIYKGFG